MGCIWPAGLQFDTLHSSNLFFYSPLFPLSQLLPESHLKGTFCVFIVFCFLLMPSHVHMKSDSQPLKVLFYIVYNIKLTSWFCLFWIFQQVGCDAETKGSFTEALATAAEKPPAEMTGKMFTIMRSSCPVRLFSDVSRRAFLWRKKTLLKFTTAVIYISWAPIKVYTPSSNIRPAVLTPELWIQFIQFIVTPVHNKVISQKIFKAS